MTAVIIAIAIASLVNVAGYVAGVRGDEDVIRAIQADSHENGRGVDRGGRCYGSFL